jgi:hypothetical protein
MQRFSCRPLVVVVLVVMSQSPIAGRQVHQR